MLTRRALILATIGLGAATMPAADDLTDLFTAQPPAALPIAYRQGRIETWNPITLENTVRVGGNTYTNLPVLGVAEAASFTAGTTVGIISVDTTWAIVGRFVIPGTGDAEDAITQIGQRSHTATVLTGENTSSTSFTDLATPGPAVNDILIPASGKVEVVVSAQFTAVSASDPCIGVVGVDVSGAATIAPDSKQSLLLVTSEPAGIQASRSLLFSGLPAGGRCNFKLMYQTGGLATVFSFRDIIVRAL